MFNSTTKTIALSFCTGLLILSGCKDDEGGNSNLSTKQEIKENYASIVYANYKDAYDDAVDLQSAINTFVATPNQTNFEAAKSAWLTSRESYGPSEAFRFANGPIDDEDGPEGLLNAWPLDESYIDYSSVAGGEHTSIVYDTTNYPEITASVLEGLNEGVDEKSISIGYHAIEFLLWGQDTTAPSAQKPGQRPYTDYVTGAEGTAKFQERRGTYLKVCADLLVEHLDLMVKEWESGQGSNYRATFDAMDEDEALTNILTAIGVLAKSELATERIFTAFDNADQEDEHSCFSDNTHRDIILNAVGIQNVYLGTYTKNDGTTITGTSIHTLISKEDSELATETATQIADAVAKCNAIPTPFDLAITNQDTKVTDAVTSLQNAGDKFAEVASKLGLSISTELPE